VRLRWQLALEDLSYLSDLQHVRKDEPLITSALLDCVSSKILELVCCLPQILHENGRVLVRNNFDNTLCPHWNAIYLAVAHDTPLFTDKSNKQFNYRHLSFLYMKFKRTKLFLVLCHFVTTIELIDNNFVVNTRYLENPSSTLRNCLIKANNENGDKMSQMSSVHLT